MSAEFVACMEDVLDLYAEPYDPEHPVVCFDETSKQLLAEKRSPIRPSREDGSDTITNTNAMAPETCSCCASPGRAGGMWW